MPNDPRFIVAVDLQEVILDKDTGFPLAAGVIKFYKDQARTEEKEVYRLSGSPPNYTYVSVGSEITLNSIGSPPYPIYYFPYEGVPDDDSNVIELYYITVVSSGAVAQFTREGWPNSAKPIPVVGDEGLKNYIPNPQFIVHNTLPADATHAANQIRAASTNIAPGGWYFERPNSSAATDFVSFKRYTSYAANPTGNPRYAVNILTTSMSLLDGYKDLRVKFKNVNMFASDDQTYTLSLNTKSNLAAIDCQARLIKNFGAGGSAQTDALIGSFTIGLTNTVSNLPFVFGTNSGKTIGTLNDDYVELAIRFPVNTLIDADLTDFVLTFGDAEIPVFPSTPYADMLSRTLAGWIPEPAYDGSDMHLPIKLGKNGFEYDRSEIGKVYATTYAVAKTGELLCNGVRYPTEGYSSDGIPYSRLQEELFDITYEVPKFGTGVDFLTCTQTHSTGQIRITQNGNGAVTTVTDGAVATGFNFQVAAGALNKNIHDGSAYNALSYYSGTADIVIENAFAAISPNPVNAVTSGFSFEILRYGSTKIRQVVKLTAIAATTLAGKCFDFGIGGASGYYVWYTVDGAGIDPAVAGYLPIRVNLFSADTADIVAQKTAEAINGWQISSIIVLAASSITAGAYFNMHTATHNYYVWYKKDGVGTDPAVPGYTGIEVDIGGSYTDVQVAYQTKRKINSKYFAVPDWNDKGFYLRSIASNAFYDPGPHLSRIPGMPGALGIIGNTELDSFGDHNHSYNYTITTDPGNEYIFKDTKTFIPPIPTDHTGNTGAAETRPRTAIVNYVIKY